MGSTILVTGRPDLLAPGLCGSRPPTVHWGPVPGASLKSCPVCGGPVKYSSAPTEQTDGVYVCTLDRTHKCPDWEVQTYRWQTTRWDDSTTTALVLAWDGQESSEGIQRALSILAVKEGLDPSHGVLWRPKTNWGEPWAWYLMANKPGKDFSTQGYMPSIRAVKSDQIIPELASQPVELRGAWALATVFAARCNGWKGVLP